MESESGGELYGTLIALGVVLAFYFLPTILACARSKRDWAAILCLNLFLGWTVIGWIIALVWSIKHDPPPADAAGGQVRVNVYHKDESAG